MKNLILLILGLFTSSVYAQKVITLDLREKNKTLPLEKQLIELDKLEEGDLYQVVILGLNTYKYDVSINNNDSIVETKLTFPTFDGIDISAFQSLISSINSSNIKLPAIVDEVEKIQPVSNQEELDNEDQMSDSGVREILTGEIEIINNFINNADLKKIISKVNTWVAVIKSHDYSTTATFNVEAFIKQRPSLIEIEKLENKITLSLAKYKDRIKGHANDIKKSEEYKILHEQNLESYSKKLLKTLGELKEKVSDTSTKEMLIYLVGQRIKLEKEYLKSLNIQAKTIQKDIDDWHFIVEIPQSYIEFDKPDALVTGLNKQQTINQILGDRNTIKLSIKNLESQAFRNQKSYQDEIDKYQKAKAFEDNKPLEGLNKETQDAYNALFKLTGEATEKVNADNTQKLIEGFANVYNHKDYAYKSMVFQLNGDYTDLTINIEPRNKNIIGFKYTGEYKIPRYKKSFFGTGSSFYISGLYDESYSTKARDTSYIATQIDTIFTTPDETIITSITSRVNDTTYNIVQEDVEKLEVGFYANINFGWCFGKRKRFSVGAGIGPGVSFTEKIRPRVLGTFNLTYGKRHKFSFGGGAIIGFTDRLSKAVDLNETFTSEPESVVVSKLTKSWAVHFGYLYVF